jgi:hypothetical protein
MSRQLVCVERGDSVTQPLGAAWLLGEVDEERVRVKFVVGRRRFVVRKAHVDFNVGTFTSAERIKKKRVRKDRKDCREQPRVGAAQEVLSSTSPAFVPGTAAGEQVLSSASPAFAPGTAAGEQVLSSASPAFAPSSVALSTPSARKTKKLRSLPTWDRLLIFGGVCDANNVYSEEGVRSLSSLLLPDGVLSWLGSLPASRSFASSMRSFVQIWCTYCGALAHCDYGSMDTRSKLLALNLVCDDIESGGGSGNVFSSLLMQCLVSTRHDQSLCSVIADVDNIGYAKRVDRAKPGVLVSSLALLRHESVYLAAKRAMDKFRAPLQRAVWQVKSNKNATTFLRVARGKLFCFPTDSGVASRLHPATNEIRYWSSELEQYVPKKEFYTTVSDVSFKKVCWLEPGALVLNCAKGGCASKVVSVKAQASAMQLVVEHANTRARITKSKNDYVLTEDSRCGQSVARLLEQCPDVVHTLCMSTGHPAGYMKKRRGRVLSAFDLRPMRLPFDQYVVWRCAVAAAVAGASGRQKKGSLKNAFEARTQLLVEKA